MDQVTLDLIRQVERLQRQVDGLAKPEILGDRFLNSYTVSAGGFSTAQDAVDYAEANGFYVIFFPPGTYGNITISVDGITVVGASVLTTIFTDTASHCVTVDADRVTLMNFRASGTAGGGNNRDAIHVNTGYFETHIHNIIPFSSDRHGIYSDSFGTIVTNTLFSGVDGTRLVFDTNSSVCTCVGNANLGASTIDNGAGNVIAHNS